MTAPASPAPWPNLWNIARRCVELLFGVVGGGPAALATMVLDPALRREVLARLRVIERFTRIAVLLEVLSLPAREIPRKLWAPRPVRPAAPNGQGRRTPEEEHPPLFRVPLEDRRGRGASRASAGAAADPADGRALARRLQAVMATLEDPRPTILRAARQRCGRLSETPPLSTAPPTEQGWRRRLAHKEADAALAAWTAWNSS
jgi:hypothetical protein